MINTGSDFSGVGAFDQALERIGIKQNKIFACDMDKYARQTYIHNYGEPKYYPKNVYDREIPKTPLDIYMTSPPCQSFSLAGKRGGGTDKRGTLFYNSHEFIVKNKPRYFIFENVKGLLSDDSGKTFQRWIDHLGGKTVNGNPVIFPLEDAVPYHVYYQVLNAKNYGVPQNRERIFIIGIRDDSDNNFSFPKPFHLVKRLKDVLEDMVDEKYYLSDKMVKGLSKKNKQDNGFTFKPKIKEDTGNCVTARCFKMGADDNYIKVKSATSKGYEIATDEDSINFTHPDSKTRRGRVGRGVAQTLDTACNQAVITAVQKDNMVIQLNQSKESGGAQPYQQNRVFDKNGISPAILANLGGDRNHNINTHKIRRLAPRECFRLMDFPDSFTWPVSDSQAYKQAGNSIVVNVLAEIIKKINL